MKYEKFEDIQVGCEASIEKVFNQEEVNMYGKISCDSNPIHYDLEYAKNTIFKKPIVHGILITSLFGGLLGSTLPGHGTIHLGLNIKFLKPIFVGEKILARLRVKSLRTEKSIIFFDCEIIKSNGDIALTGEQVVMFKEKI
ncbi:MAG: MaoC family dehydratase [Prolixibacteraceae bacterium]|nr:MaoC family dehydratase [Prolixibacteraceae bacterium]